jgi:hypothetical protein
MNYRETLSSSSSQNKKVSSKDKGDIIAIHVKQKIDLARTKGE